MLLSKFLVDNLWISMLITLKTINKANFETHNVYKGKNSVLIYEFVEFN